MFEKRKSMIALAATVLLGLGAGGVSVGAALDTLSGDPGNHAATAQENERDETIDFSSGPVQCQILAETENGMMVVQPVVHTLEAVEGSYVMKITSRNGANRATIQQGGYFSAHIGDATVLGRMMLGTGGTHDISLKIAAGELNIECAERLRPDA